MEQQSHDPAFDQLVERAQAAVERFVSGDAAPFAALWSHRPDVTIFGAFGTPQRGWAEVRSRMAWAAARAVPAAGAVTFEELSRGVSGDLAYTIWLERSERRVGAEGRAPVVLRATHLFRREAEGWRIIHRHADPIISSTAATAVLQR
ncbi:MAG TPA: nuclear transport factor 2 family protein [Thermomicrobiales bacterium]|nr:nuclear transport factor 2 family protein [Thermomicrobiales bacterium]